MKTCHLCNGCIGEGFSNLTVAKIFGVVAMLVSALTWKA